MSTSNEQPDFFDSIRWPLIVFGLLLGHTSIMLVAMALATADPPKIVEGSPYAPSTASEQAESEALP